MLQSMRKHSKGWLAIFLFGLLIMSFAAWGIGDMFRGGGQSQEVAEVGDLAITIQEFNRDLQREMRRLQPLFNGQLDTEQARQFGIFDQVLSGMVLRTLLELGARDAGVTVSDAAILDRIRAAPAFQSERGEFDRARFDRAVFNSGLGEGGYLADLRRALGRDQVAGAVIAGSAAPDGLLDPLFQYRQERRVVAAIPVTRDDVDGIEPPDGAALAAYHREHGEDFMAPELRALTAVTLMAADLAEEIAVSEDRLRQDYEARIAEFEEPERRTLEQILLADAQSAERAYGLIQQGRDFAAVSEEVAGALPLPLGPIERAMIEGQEPALAEAIFGTAIGEVPPPVESPLGWHVLRVTEIEPAVRHTFEEVRDDLARAAALDEAADAIYDLSNRLDDELAGGASLEEAAGSLNLPVRFIESIDATGRDAAGEPLPDLPQSGSELLEAAFTTPVGEESLMTEVGTEGYFVLRVDGVTPPAIRPLATIRDDVAAAWLEEEKDAAAKARAEELFAQIKIGGNAEALAAVNGLRFERTAPFTRGEPDMVLGITEAMAQEIFALNLGEAMMAPSAGGYLIARLESIEAADPATDREAAEALRAQLREAIENDLMSQFQGALMSRYPVEVNRATFDQFM